MWANKDDVRILGMDVREEVVSMVDRGSIRTLGVHPHVLGDFRRMPFADGAFAQVMFDPPHLLNAWERGWLRKKYGVLNKETWREDLRRGFQECWRVLAPLGTLVYKWNTCQVALAEVSPMFPDEPTFHTRVDRTHVFIFIKPGRKENNHDRA